MRVKLNSMTLADGAIMDMFDHQLKKVMANIADPSTGAATKRKITIEVEFAPDESRSMVGITISGQATLAHIKPVKSAALLENQDGKLEAFVNQEEDSGELPGTVLAFKQA